MTKALARYTDPETSYAAAVAAAQSNLEQWTLKLLAEHGPLTCGAMSILTGIPRDHWSPRMKHLEEQGKVRRVGTMKTDGKRRQILWEIVR